MCLTSTNIHAYGVAHQQQTQTILTTHPHLRQQQRQQQQQMGQQAIQVAVPLQPLSGTEKHVFLAFCLSIGSIPPIPASTVLLARTMTSASNNAELAPKELTSTSLLTLANDTILRLIYIFLVFYIYLT